MRKYVPMPSHRPAMPAILRYLRYLRYSAMSRVAAFFLSFLPPLPPCLLVYESEAFGEEVRNAARRKRKANKKKRATICYLYRPGGEGRRDVLEAQWIWNARLDFGQTRTWCRANSRLATVSHKFMWSRGRLLSWRSLHLPLVRFLSPSPSLPLPTPKHGPRWHGMNVQLALAPGPSVPSLVPSILSKPALDPSI